MTLLSQAFAAVLAAALLSRRARARGGAASIQAMVVVVAVAALTFVAMGSVWSASKGLWNDRRAYAKVPAAQVPLVPGLTIGANVPFVEWLNGQIPAGDDFYMVAPAAGRDEATYQWATYRLYPRVVADDPKNARWIVFDGSTPAESGFQRSEFARVLRFGDGLLLADRGGGR